MKAIIVIAAALSLVGCQKTVSEMSYSEVRALAKEIGDRCEAQGFKHPSVEFKQCTEHESRREIAGREESKSDRQALGMALAEGSAGFGAAMASPRAVTCNRFGNSVTCF